MRVLKVMAEHRSPRRQRGPDADAPPSGMRRTRSRSAGETLATAGAAQSGGPAVRRTRSRSREPAGGTLCDSRPVAAAAPPAAVIPAPAMRRTRSAQRREEEAKQAAESEAEAARAEVATLQAEARAREAAEVRHVKLAVAEAEKKIELANKWLAEQSDCRHVSANRLSVVLADLHIMWPGCSVECAPLPPPNAESAPVALASHIVLVRFFLQVGCTSISLEP